MTALNNEVPNGQAQLDQFKNFGENAAIHIFDPDNNGNMDFLRELRTSPHVMEWMAGGPEDFQTDDDQPFIKQLTQNSFLIEEMFCLVLQTRKKLCFRYLLHECLQQAVYYLPIPLLHQLHNYPGFH